MGTHCYARSLSTATQAAHGPTDHCQPVHRHNPHTKAAILTSMRLCMAHAFVNSKEINRAEALAALLATRGPSKSCPCSKDKCLLWQQSLIRLKTKSQEGLSQAGLSQKMRKSSSSLEVDQLEPGNLEDPEAGSPRHEQRPADNPGKVQASRKSSHS